VFHHSAAPVGIALHQEGDRAMRKLAQRRRCAPSLLLVIGFLLLAAFLIPTLVSAGVQSPPEGSKPQSSAIEGMQGAGGGPPPPSPAGEGDPDDIEAIPMIVVELLLGTRFFYLVL
jgi:hypothetical protein